MLPLQTSLSNLLFRVESWTHSSKALVIMTLFIFAAIPLTVLGVFGLRTFTPEAATVTVGILSPSGVTNTTSPTFTWNCECSASSFRIQLRENDADFGFGSWRKDIIGKNGVNTTRYNGFEALNYQSPPSVLKKGVTYFWNVVCLDGGCASLAPVSFVVKDSATQKPSVPTGLSISQVDQNSFTLSWLASSDNTAIANYSIAYSLGSGVQLQGNSSTPSFQVSPYIGGQSYSFSVSASDAAGNTSTSSSKFTYKAPDKDSDKDGFNDSVEVYLGTDVSVACKGPKSWPPDLNGDGKVDAQDVAIITKNLGLVRTSVDSPASRYDLNQNGVVDQGDVNIVKSYLGKSC